jgi:predicted RNase H-like HicB family nuclease
MTWVLECRLQSASNPYYNVTHLFGVYFLPKYGIMSPVTLSRTKIMTYDVILRKKDNRYIARVHNWPELIIEENTREAAITQIKEELVEYLSQPPEIIQIDLEPIAETNPWLKFAGMWASDPTWEEFLAEVEAYRREIDEVSPEA